MSVRVGERGENRLEVLDAARILAAYTINTCKSDKVFPKSQRWIMANRIVNECLDACTSIKKANATRLAEESAIRKRHQEEAFKSLETMLMLIDIAYNTFDVPTKKVEHWTSLIVNTEIKLKAWKKSDKERLG